MGNHGSVSQGGSHETVTQDQTCVICQENVNNDVSRPDCCPYHFFHHKCLMEWAKHKNTCPLDNKPFQSIIDRRGKKIPIPKPAKSVTENELSALFAHMLALHQLLQQTQFKCSACNEEESSLERSKTDVCDHRFHRKCLAQLARISNICPVQDCNSEFTELRCEFGETIPVRDLRERFHCTLCNKDDPSETAAPDGCMHRFHRLCLYEHSKEHEKCPIDDCRSSVQFIRCENGDRIVIQNLHQAFECGLCDLDDREKEAAVVNPCGHIFHRECILGRYHSINNCPLENCSNPIDGITCQFGDSFEKTANPFNRLIASITCDDDYKCFICETKNEEWERAKLPCGCEFHRRCVVQVARLQDELLCPRCKQEYGTIQCLFGDSLTVQKRPRQQTDSQSIATTTTATTSLLKSDDSPIPEPQILTSSEDDASEAQGAAGGTDVALEVCNLCDAEIPRNERYRPKDCHHWYHDICMRNLSQEIGCCIKCQGAINKIYDEHDNEISVGDIPTSSSTHNNNPPIRCYTCGDVVRMHEAVRPESCSCIFHRQCLVNIKEIMSFCPICDSTIKSIVDLV